ncbi:hypothetical protein NBRC116591_41190 [Sessilibacter corallicola]|uniref:Uncharacterized protein n=1 Tax=Sessilibacter corallicola TaxID=2904075 RepID=A0ABQ0AF78_9GAMM
MREQCVDFITGDRVAFEFTSKYPLDFNVHYHTDNATTFPVKESGIATYRGEFVVGDVEQYCFMWTNRQRVSERWEFTMEYTTSQETGVTP